MGKGKEKKSSYPNSIYTFITYPPLFDETERSKGL
jgi:hypothetical protein